jgi:hypothetical protein
MPQEKAWRCHKRCRAFCIVPFALLLSHQEYTMRLTIIAAGLFAATSALAFAQTGTANGNTGRVNNGTASTASDIHNTNTSTVAQPGGRKGSQSAQAAKNRSEKLINASGASGKQAASPSTRGSHTAGVAVTPDPDSDANVGGTNR